MATVWAPFNAPGIGSWQDRAYPTGWSDTIQFTSLRDLLDQMHLRGGLRGSVTRLGIVAHGTIDGEVQLDRRLTSATVRTFAIELDELRWYLTPLAQFIFYSCIAGAGIDGANLLNALSVSLPGRTVIGFIVWGETSASDALSNISPQSPGQVHEAPDGVGSGRAGSVGLLRPGSEYARWSRNGIIVRNAPLYRDRQNHCANPACPGHASIYDNCPGWP